MQFGTSNIQMKVKGYTNPDCDPQDDGFPCSQEDIFAKDTFIDLENKQQKNHIYFLIFMFPFRTLMSLKNPSWRVVINWQPIDQLNR